MSTSGSGDDDDHPERSDSSGDDTRRRRSKGPSGSGSDPAAGYANSLNSADIDDAQQTLTEIESNIEEVDAGADAEAGAAEDADEADQASGIGVAAGGAAAAGGGDVESDVVGEADARKTLADVDVDEPSQLAGGIAAAIDDDRDDFHDIRHEVVEADTVIDAEGIFTERLTPDEIDAAVAEIELQEQMRQDYKPVMDLTDLEAGEEVLYDADIPKRGVIEEIGATAWMDDANRERMSPIEFDGEVYVESATSATTGEGGVEVTGERLDTSEDSVFTASELQQSDVVEQIDNELTNVGAEDIRSLAEDDLSPDAPEGANLDNAVRFKSMELDGYVGSSFGALWKTEAPDGTVTYTTFTQIGANPLEMTNAAQALDSALSDEGQQRAGFPALYADGERGAAVHGEAGAADATSAGSYDPDSTQAEFDKRDFVDSVAAKLLIGDTDFKGNIAASSSGEFRPIDYDLGGNDLAEEDDLSDDPMYDQYDGVLEAVQSECRYMTRNFEFDVTEHNIRQSLQSLAHEVDTDEFASQLEAATYISDELKSTMLKNIETARSGEL